MSTQAPRRLHTNTRMSQAVIRNGTVYLAGQVADDVGADIGEQTRQVLAKIDRLLGEAGSSRDRLLTATIYLRDMREFAAMNEVWDAWVSHGNAPARATLEARMARPDLRIEIVAVAALQM